MLELVFGTINYVMTTVSYKGINTSSVTLLSMYCEDLPNRKGFFFIAVNLRKIFFLLYLFSVFLFRHVKSKSYILRCPYPSDWTIHVLASVCVLLDYQPSRTAMQSPTVEAPPASR